MNKFEIIRGQGGVPKSLPGEDHISGLMVYLPDTDLPVADAGVTGFSVSNRIIAVSTIETAEKLGIKKDSAKWIHKVLHYHLSEAFRVNPGISLYVGLFKTPTAAYDFVEVKAMQNFASGRLRQIGVYCGDKALAAAEIIALQGVATTLESQDMPLSIIYSPKVADVSSAVDVSATGRRNVSVIIGQDGDGLGATLYTDASNTVAKSAVGIMGIVLGMVSKASVHESIGWVQKFPAGITTPGFVDGTLLKNLDKATVESLDTKRFLFLVTYGGFGDSYMNDSHTLDVATSDYAFIENERTMDKAVRGIRTYLLPYLSSPIYVDAKSGKMRADTVANLKNVANQALRQMEKTGEISGYVVDIDPEQVVLTTQTVEFVVRKVDVGVMRKIKINIGNTTQI